MKSWESNLITLRKILLKITSMIRLGSYDNGNSNPFPIQLLRSASKYLTQTDQSHFSFWNLFS